MVSASFSYNIKMAKRHSVTCGLKLHASWRNFHPSYDARGKGKGLRKPAPSCYITIHYLVHTNWSIKWNKFCLCIVLTLTMQLQCSCNTDAKQKGHDRKIAHFTQPMGCCPYADGMLDEKKFGWTFLKKSKLRQNVHDECHLTMDLWGNAGW